MYVEKSYQTVGEYLDEWLGAIASTVRPATHYSYGRNLRLHVVPYVGTTRLTTLDAGMLNTLYTTLLAEGSRHYRGGGLSPRSVRYVHTILHRGLKDAVRWGRLARNPADAADPPRASAMPSPELKTWTADELRYFLEYIAEDRLHPAFMLLATTGMRRGEALGIPWADLDLEASRVSIRQTVIVINHKVRFGTPKTAKGKRTVALDTVSVAALRVHRQRQLEERMLMGAGWQDHGLVFTTPLGGPLHPERFSRDFNKQVARAGLPRITLHSLRHTWATLALEAGVNPKVVQERLGHAGIAITLQVYSHVSTTMQANAAETVAGLVFGPLAIR